MRPTQCVGGLYLMVADPLAPLPFNNNNIRKRLAALCASRPMVGKTLALGLKYFELHTMQTFVVLKLI